MLFLLVLYFFFFKQKTAYEMRISDWSSDVCSSDLIQRAVGIGISAGDIAAGVCRDGRGFVFDRGRYDIQRGRRRDRGRNLGRVAAGRRVVRALTDQAGRTEYNTVVVVSHVTTRAQRDIALHLPTNFVDEAGGASGGCAA